MPHEWTKPCLSVYCFMHTYSGWFKSHLLRKNFLSVKLKCKWRDKVQGLYKKVNRSCLFTTEHAVKNWRACIYSGMYIRHIPNTNSCVNMNEQDQVPGMCQHISHTQNAWTYVLHTNDSSYAMWTYNTTEKSHLVVTLLGVITCLLLPFLVCSFNSSSYTYTEFTILTKRTLLWKCPGARNIFMV